MINKELLYDFYPRHSIIYHKKKDQKHHSMNYFLHVDTFLHS